MARRKNDFSEEEKIKVLLWCGRHCCLCGKFAGIHIEVAHLDPKSSDINDAMPLCFDCHAAVGHYNKSRPRGKKYSIKELRARRNQVYERETNHLLSPVHYKLTQKGCELPAVRFQITHQGTTYPLRARIRVTLGHGSRLLGYPSTKGHYDGRYLWNLNPGFTVDGNFRIPDGVVQDRTLATIPVKARIEVTLIDIYEWEHNILPGIHVYDLGGGDWYFEPSEEEFKTTTTP